MSLAVEPVRYPDQNYPILAENIVYSENAATTRSVTAEKFKINNTKKTFIGDATRPWNSAPQSVKISVNSKKGSKKVL